jgi:diadenosine tetraphosphatase ApaH/serine/threonine PP2A family protein phosphatase
VGQQRDKDPRASFAVVNLEEFTADILRVRYDVEKVNERIIDSGLPKILGERLFKGK